MSPAVNIDELQALARAVEPLEKPVGGTDGRGQVVEFNDLVFRFRERITRALEGLTRGHGVDPGVKLELWLLAKALPGARRDAEAAVLGEQPSRVGQVAQARASSR
jgi:hypothetical protein